MAGRPRVDVGAAVYLVDASPDTGASGRGAAPVDGRVPTPGTNLPTRSA
jgi:hypothetical protein